MDGRDSGGSRFGRTAETEKSASYQKLSPKLRNRTGQNADEGALTGSIFSGEHVNLTGVYRERDAIERANGSEPLGDAAQLDARRTTGLHLWGVAATTRRARTPGVAWVRSDPCFHAIRPSRD